jgi:Family of unknown function (DUF6497)
MTEMVPRHHRVIATLLATLFATVQAGAQTGGAIVIPAEDTAPVDVPSGQPVTPLDVILNEPGPMGTAVRFRFIAPEIAPGKSISFDTATADMLDICTTYAMPRLDNPDTMPDQIIISLSDRDVPFGQTDPDATQFFEAYSIEGDACVWEMF